VFEKVDVVEKILAHMGLWVEGERELPKDIKHAEYEDVMREVFDD